MIQSFANELIKRIRKDLNNYADDLASGHCVNFEAYQHLCGVIRGLAQAESYIIDLAKNQEEHDE